MSWRRKRETRKGGLSICRGCKGQEVIFHTEMKPGVQIIKGGERRRKGSMQSLAKRIKEGREPLPGRDKKTREGNKAIEVLCESHSNLPVGLFEGNGEGKRRGKAVWG